jgi:DnaJ-domain-containing protein 1
VGIFDRLGDVIKSYLNQEDERIFGSPRYRRGDPDLEDAEAELESFLRGEGRGNSGGDWSDSRTGGGKGGGYGDRAGGRRQTDGEGRRGGAVPKELRPDFAELGLPFGAGAEDCKAAYKRLLKLHHPDRHAGHEGNMKKATAKSARINAAYDRIETWRRRAGAQSGANG